MPFYRIGGAMVHMHGKNLAKPCDTQVIVTPPKGIPRREYCAAPSAFLCDWPRAGGKTCDRALCADHATEVAPNRHYCPLHAGKATRPDLLTPELLAEHEEAVRQATQRNAQANLFGP